MDLQQLDKLLRPALPKDKNLQKVFRNIKFHGETATLFDEHFGVKVYNVGIYDNFLVDAEEFLKVCKAFSGEEVGVDLDEKGKLYFSSGSLAMGLTTKDVGNYPDFRGPEELHHTPERFLEVLKEALHSTGGKSDPGETQYVGLTDEYAYATDVNEITRVKLFNTLGGFYFHTSVVKKLAKYGNPEKFARQNDYLWFFYPWGEVFIRKPQINIDYSQFDTVLDFEQVADEDGGYISVSPDLTSDLKKILLVEGPDASVKLVFRGSMLEVSTESSLCRVPTGTTRSDLNVTVFLSLSRLLKSLENFEVFNFDLSDVVNGRNRMVRFRQSDAITHVIPVLA